MTRLLLVPLLALVTASAAAQPPRPLLWRISDNNNQVYLLGSFHALKADDYPLAASVDAAFADAETVVFEISPEEMNSPELSRKLLAAGALSNGRTLQQSMSAQSWEKLQRYAVKRSLPLQDYQHLEPWFVAMLISLKEMSQVGYDPKQGLDRHLIAQAAATGKRTGGLETAEQQISALDSMSPVEQQQSLSESLGEAEDFKAKIDQLHALWRSGNLNALEAMLAVEFKRDYPQLYQRMNVQRNQAWLPKIRRMLDEENHDETLVVVGSLHLLGADGLVSQLKAQGYRVERL